MYVYVYAYRFEDQVGRKKKREEEIERSKEAERILERIEEKACMYVYFNIGQGWLSCPSVLGLRVKQDERKEGKSFS